MLLLVVVMTIRNNNDLFSPVDGTWWYFGGATILHWSYRCHPRCFFKMLSSAFEGDYTVLGGANDIGGTIMMII